jgi:disulfide bond formation protein DsbB
MAVAQLLKGGKRAISTDMRVNAMQGAGLVGGVLAGMGLLTAILSESVLGLVPCALCLVERWPYRLAILFGALALASPRGARFFVTLTALAMLGAAVLGGVHVGVEQGDWPSPLPECAAPVLGSGTMAERLARMPAKPAKPCDEPTFLIPGVPLSMAAMNLCFASAIAVGLGVMAIRGRNTP